MKVVVPDANLRARQSSDNRESAWDIDAEQLVVL